VEAAFVASTPPSDNEEVGSSQSLHRLEALGAKKGSPSERGWAVGTCFDWLDDQQDRIGQLRNCLGKIPNQAGDDELNQSGADNNLVIKCGDSVNPRRKVGSVALL
jgi:hypothetical protein